MGPVATTGPRGPFRVSPQKSRGLREPPATHDDLVTPVAFGLGSVWALLDSILSLTDKTGSWSPGIAEIP